jgi:hypothetical protein
MGRDRSCLFDSPLLTIPDAQRLPGVACRSARSIVQGLVPAGILRQIGDPRTARQAWPTRSRTRPVRVAVEIVVSSQTPQFP